MNLLLLYKKKKKIHLYRFLQMKHTTAIQLEQILQKVYTPALLDLLSNILELVSANITNVDG